MIDFIIKLKIHLFIMKYKKKLAILEARRRAYEALKDKRGYTKPGSQKGKW